MKPQSVQPADADIFGASFVLFLSPTSTIGNPRPWISFCPLLSSRQFPQFRRRLLRLLLRFSGRPCEMIFRRLSTMLVGNRIAMTQPLRSNVGQERLNANISFYRASGRRLLLPMLRFGKPNNLAFSSTGPQPPAFQQTGFLQSNEAVPRREIIGRGYAATTANGYRLTLGQLPQDRPNSLGAPAIATCAPIHSHCYPA